MLATTSTQTARSLLGWGMPIVGAAVLVTFAAKLEIRLLEKRGARVDWVSRRRIFLLPALIQGVLSLPPILILVAKNSTIG